MENKLFGINSGIYKITNTKNNKFYIDSAANFDVRWKKHLQKLRTNKHPNIHLQRAYNKDGEPSFSFSVLLTCATEDLIKQEQVFLDSEQPHYNICKIAGSTTGVIRREETKEKLRAAATGKKQSKETIEKRMIQVRGRKFVYTAESKERQREAKRGVNNPMFKIGWDGQVLAMKLANLGVPRKDETKKKIGLAHSKAIYQLTLSGDIVKEWPSSCAVQRELGWLNQAINLVCNGKKKTYKGFTWAFKLVLKDE